MSLGLMNKTLLGGTAVAGVGAYAGMKYNPGREEDPVEKTKAGIMLAGIPLVAAGAGAYAIGPKRLAGGIWKGASGYASSVKSSYVREASKVGHLKALPKLATVPIMAGVGAVIGAGIAGEDHRTAGAAVGAAAGVGASALIRGGYSYSKLPGFAKFGVKAGVAAMLIGVASSAGKQHASAEAALAPDDATGMNDYADPSVAQHSGAGRRMRNMNASGDIALGAHRKRHG